MDAMRLLPLALLLSAPAWGQVKGAADPLNVYTAIDSDGNGLISEREARAVPGLSPRFGRLDSNNSGQLDFREFSAFEIAGPGQPTGGQALAFEAVDTDDDGAISQEEAAVYPALVQDWLRLDGDESGTLNRAEFAAFERPGDVIAPAPSNAGSFEALDQDGNGLIDPTEARIDDLLVKRWPQLDTDESGTLDRAEFAAAAQAEAADTPSMEPADFAALDTDGDGAISRGEAAANPYLVDNWRRLDNDGDDRLDRAEFSTFERIFKDGLRRLPPTSGR